MAQDDAAGAIKQLQGSRLAGPLTLLGLVVAVLVCAADQASKLWLLFDYELGSRGVVSLGPVLNLVLVWNKGISYGWLQQESALGRYLLLAFTVAAVAVLWGWLARTGSKLTAVALGLIIGGAVGNAIDRVAYRAVADFVDFHVFNFHWYVFNLADAAIVAGVIGLLYEALFVGNAAKAP
jgi:signal peptidase II